MFFCLTHNFKFSWVISLLLFDCSQHRLQKEAFFIKRAGSVGAGAVFGFWLHWVRLFLFKVKINHFNNSWIGRNNTCSCGLMIYTVCGASTRFPYMWWSLKTSLTGRPPQSFLETIRTAYLAEPNRSSLLVVSFPWGLKCSQSETQ